MVRYTHEFTNRIQKNATTVVKTEMLEYHFNNLGGWAGDLQTLMINTYIQLDGSDNYDEFL